MLTFTTPSPAGVVRVVVSGTLSKADYDAVVPALERAIEETGAVHLLVEVHDFDAVTPAALWQEVKFDLRHARDIGRFAVVGDAAWLRPLVPLADAVVGEARLYPAAEREAAHTWILNGP